MSIGTESIAHGAWKKKKRCMFKINLKKIPHMALPVPTRCGSAHDDPYSATSPRFENDVVNLAA